MEPQSNSSWSSSSSTSLKSIACGGLNFNWHAAQAPHAKAKPAPKKVVKNDPKLVAAARELRDRWLEQYNSGEGVTTALGKYDVSRALSAPVAASLLPGPIAA